MNNKENGTHPAYVKRVGAVRLAVWEKEAAEGRIFHNVSILRRYKDGEEWKDSSTFNGLSDLASLKEALAHVTAWISHREDSIAQEGEE
ncbi:MAG: hypothetical protein NTY19_23660 [Planctomycetota bacterium]|nr:hypothetical protein [Planctomycetota bacterium]